MGNLDRDQPVFGFAGDRYYCVKNGCGEPAHAWSVVELGGLDPQAAMICAVKIQFFCDKHWYERESGLMGVRADLFPIDPGAEPDDKRSR